MRTFSDKVDRISLEFKARKRELLIDFGEKIIRELEKLIARFSKIDNTAFFEPNQFPWTKGLEANWEIIRDELREVLKHREELPNFQDISTDQYNITQDDRWKTFFFYAYGIKIEQNCLRCPETTRLIEAIPEMKTAFFSILMPHKHIPPHCGPYKGLVRYHLGLVVPQPEENCRIRVDREIRHWQEGKSLMFDDSFEHEVWNETDGMRVVLFMDTIRPLRFPVSLFNQLIIELIARSPYIQDAKVNQDKWEERLEKVMPTRK
jgi:ornithine lipid ester-linked acyl 2-hydroxylase